MSTGCTLALVVLFIIGGIAAGAFTWALCRMAAIKEVVQFVEMVRQAAHRSGYPLYCQVCSRETQHIYLGRHGKYERYQCPLCNVIKDFTVK